VVCDCVVSFFVECGCFFGECVDVVVDVCVVFLLVVVECVDYCKWFLCGCVVV